MPLGDIDPEIQRLFQILRDAPNGLGEYELLEVLRGTGPVRGLAELELFRVHFLLFHHLHRLRVVLEARGLGTMEIHCLKIRLVPTASRPSTPGTLPVAADPLAEYYLDLQNLARTTQEDVQSLLRWFWARYRVYGRKEEALAALGLGVKATPSEIRRRYRELTLLHHPDRGGEGKEFHRVAEAMKVLRLLESPGVSES